MEPVREKLLKLHDGLYCGTNSEDKPDMELIVDLIECLSEEIEKSKEHSHTVL